MGILQKLRERSGVLLPVAIVTMLMTGGLAYYTTQALLDRKYLNQDANLTSYAQREADNAMAYALWAANTSAAENAGGRRDTTFTNGSEIEVTNDDGGVNETKEGHTVKRFVQFKDGQLIATGKIYNASGVLIAERKASMNCNPTYPIRIQKDSLQYYD